MDNQIIKTQMWDVSGDVKFRSILTPYFKSKCGIMLFYDVSEISTFNHLVDWINKFIQKDNNTPVIIAPIASTHDGINIISGDS